MVDAPVLEELPHWVPMPPPQPDVEPIPDEAALNELSNAVLQLSRQSLAEPPAAFNFQPAELQTSNVRRTPHALYDLSYTFLFIPRLPHITLIGDLKTRLEQWLALLADAREWQTQFLSIEPTHIEISLACPPTESPERIIKAILLETSTRVLEDFPRFAAAHSKRPGAFWSPGYYVVAPGRRLSPAEVSAFIEYQRREQNP
ncbi:MAG: IS200/IS605 family transposase [Chloroflexi bacterium]|nr:IS200/IS605 family transposase [Chloroflexota bacterium]